MRLIDADDVVESLKDWFIMNRYYHPYSKSNLIPSTEVIDIINRSPTIEGRKTGELEEQTVMGYPLKELVIFATVCRQHNISNEKLSDFFNDLSAAYKIIMSEVRERIGEVLDATIT